MLSRYLDCFKVDASLWDPSKSEDATAIQPLSAASAVLLPSRERGFHAGSFSGSFTYLFLTIVRGPEKACAW